MQKIGLLSSSVDLVWVHTSVEGPELAEKIGSADIPLFVNTVWDVHDFTGPESKEVVPMYDYLVCPSKGMKKNFGKVAEGDNCRVIYNKCPTILARDPKKPIENTVVLTSGLDHKGGVTWRDYTWVQSLVKGQGMRLFIYSGSPAPDLIYSYENLFRYLPLWYMMNALGQYGFGWAGAANDRHTIHDCVTNKFWEYLAAGVPVMTYNSNEMKEIAQGLGVEYGTDKVRENVQNAIGYGKVFLEHDQELLRLMKGE